MPDGIVMVDGKPYMPDGVGKLSAVEAIPPLKKLRDEVVRAEFGFALALAEQISRFKGHVMTNLGNFDALVQQEFNVTVGGAKGNRTYTSFDGLWKIEVRMQDQIAYGPELQAAKPLFDACLNEWASDTRPALRSIVANAFDTDKEGKINRTNIHMLLNTEDDDPRWKRGQDALREAMYVIGSKEYIRFSMRESCKSRWTAVTIDLANA
ncbi:DUF3164 family protein [Paracoccus denitrificans]|uniref:DUF3164 family protein n=1 Tax=Paracoccus denitrificans TaxID=266 RepID=UPI003364C05D